MENSTNIVVEKKNITSHVVEKMFENVKYYEELCDNLPTVPEDVDEEIESKLKKLRKFNKVRLNGGKNAEEICKEIT